MKILIGTMFLLFGAPAMAQDKPAKTSKTKRRPGVIKIKALKVEGVIQKPEAFYILQRSELNFKGLEPQKSFIPLILKSVEKEPF
ncbi:MAG: hypothetical protein ACI9U2_000197 [Bradymonadia bacterium]|jgi:hypothetical protein